MRRIAKKIAAAVLSLTLVFAVSTSCFGANAWDSYFGLNEDWYEGAEGTLSGASSVTGFTANITAVGWGGVWGGQVFLSDTSKLVNVKKGESYTISFTAKSSNVTKYIYVKVATGDVLATSFWVKIPAGSKGATVSKTFTAKAKANTVYFGVGGDVGDRSGVSSDPDADARYKVFDTQFKKSHLTELPNDAGGEFTAATKITVSNFSLLPKAAVSSAKSTAKKTVKVVAKKASTGVKKTVAGYQFKVGTKKVAKSGTSVTVKGLKSGKKVKVQVRTYSKGKKAYGPWSKAKTVKVK